MTTASASLPRRAERLVPWLAAAIFVGAVNALVTLAGVQPSPEEWAALVVGLCGALAVTGLVAARVSRAADAGELEVHHWPSLQELAAVDDAFGGVRLGGPSTYLEGVEHWAQAVLELTDHGATAPHVTSAVAAELGAAGAVTRDLLELLRASIEVPVGVNGMATLHSVCSSWEADQPRVERLVAQLDPEWHRRWCARSVVVRRACRDGRPGHDLLLPYGN